MSTDRVRPMVVNATPTIPGNSQFTMCLDSTRGLIQTVTASASRIVPGTFRSRWAGGRIRGYVTSIGQAATLNLLVGADTDVTTNAFWAVDTTAIGGGTYALAAGTAQPINWLPPAADWAIEVQAGATAMSDFDNSLLVFWDPST